MAIKIINKLIPLLSIIAVLLCYSCQQEVFTEPPNNNKIDVCSAYIGSNPPNAKIYIDDRYSGFCTPDTVKWLSEEQHKVTLKFNLIRDTSIIFTPAVTEVKNIFIDYFAWPGNYGSIVCKSTPEGSSVYLDGIDKSIKTPGTLTKLFPGEYNVKFRSVGYRDDSSYVTVYGGRTSYLTLKLQDTSVWLDYKNNNSKIPSNKVLSVKEDNQKNVWLGTLDNGISKCTNGKFTNYNTSNSGLLNNFTTCIEIDKDNNVWVGTIDGLAKFNGTTWTVYKKGTSSLPDNYITTIYADANNNVWVGTINGLVRITNGVLTVYKTSNSGIANNGISTVTSDKQGRTWIGVSGAISCLDNGTWTTYTRENHGLAGHTAKCMVVEPDGNILAAFEENLISGIYGGLMRFDGTDWRAVSITGIPAGRIQGIFIDSKGNKWLSSASGFLVMKTDNTQILYRSTQYAMSSFDVRSIVVDDNAAWIALYNGGLLKWKRGNL